MPGIDVGLPKRLSHRIALAVGLVVFVGVFIWRLIIYRSSGLPVGFTAIMSIAHVAMGLGFFAGFMALLFSRMTGQ